MTCQRGFRAFDLEVPGTKSLAAFTLAVLRGQHRVDDWQVHLLLALHDRRQHGLRDKLMPVHTMICNKPSHNQRVKATGDCTASGREQDLYHARDAVHLYRAPGGGDSGSEVRGNPEKFWSGGLPCVTMAGHRAAAPETCISGFRMRIRKPRTGDAANVVELAKQIDQASLTGQV